MYKTPSSPPPPDTPDEARAEKMRAYRKAYWQRFRKTRKRVYGTLSAQQYAALEERALAARRAVWTQLLAESESYAAGEYLPTREVETLLSELVAQLRRIGNNLNQLARAENRGREIDPQQLLLLADSLEQQIRQFISQPWGERPAAYPDKADNETPP